MKARKTSGAGSAAARRYLAKAEEFLEEGEAALGQERWNAAGLVAIHSGIASADAVLAERAGVRNLETNHSAVLALLDERVAEFSASNRRQLAGLLKVKNQVEYEDRLVTEIEAAQLMDHARRLARWARAMVQPPTQ